MTNLIRAGRYSPEVVAEAQAAPGEWVVFERRTVPPAGPLRTRTARLASARALNVQRVARRRGICLDVTTLTRGTTVTAFVRVDAPE